MLNFIYKQPMPNTIECIEHINHTKVPRGVRKEPWSNYDFKINEKHNGLIADIYDEADYLEKLTNADKTDTKYYEYLLQQLNWTRNNVVCEIQKIIGIYFTDYSHCDTLWTKRKYQNDIVKLLTGKLDPRDENAPPLESTTREKMDRLRRERKEHARLTRHLEKYRKKLYKQKKSIRNKCKKQKLAIM
jgi:hypothetical protein